MTAQEIASEVMFTSEEAVENGFHRLIVCGDTNMKLELGSKIKMGLVILEAVKGDCEYLYT